MALMVTGHRQLVPAGWTGNPWPENNQAVQKHHTEIFQKMVTFCGAFAIAEYEAGVLRPEFITGMALGADQLFAQAVLRLKDEGLSCKLIAAVPFLGQESKWTRRAKEIYEVIISKCDVAIQVCDPGYAAWKMQKRNEWMVDRSSRVLAIWDGSTSGGTYNCVSYAKMKGRVINRLDPKTLTFYDV